MFVVGAEELINFNSFLLSPRGVWPAPLALFLHETLLLVKAQEKLQGAL